MKTLFSRAVLSGAIALASSGLAQAADLPAGTTTTTVTSTTPAVDTQQLQSQIQDLTKKMQALQNQLDAVAAAQQPLPASLAAFQKISLWGYGEIYYTRPTKKGSDTQFDLARAVFGIGYQFNEDTRFNSEFEVEHAVTSASDPGEFEVEQFYVDHRVNDSLNVEGGLFLIPAGLLNESHEPTNFYGVQRNFVETLIVPSTWREGGLALHGDTAQGLRWSVGVTSGVDLSKWNFNPEYPQYNTALDMINNGPAPMQATHQELALANGSHTSQFLSLNYLGLPGFDVGATVFTGDVVKTSQLLEGSQRLTLWEAHTRWTPGKFDLSALYAHGSITGTEGSNALNPGTANPIPAGFYGYYGQVAYNIWQHGEQHVSPFFRAERYNMGDKFQGLAPGFGPVPQGAVILSNGEVGVWPSLGDTVYTLGANYYLTPSVVFKADYQRFTNNTVFNRIDLGMGLAF